MKKIYMLALGTLLTNVLMAQITVYQEDFANGISSWTSETFDMGVDGDGPETPAGFDGWSYDFNGPSGTLRTGTPAIASTTAANGFAMFDSDSINTVGPDNDGVWDNFTGRLTSPVIVLETGKIYSLSFETNWEENGGGDLSLEVSDDDFATIHAVGDAKTVTEGENGIVSFAISGLTNPANTKIRLNAVAQEAYYWMVDDIKIIEQPSMDLKIKEAHQTYSIDNNWAESSTDLTLIPAKHAPDMHFWATVDNTGSAERTNSKLNVEATSSSGSFTLNGTVTKTLPIGAVDSVLWVGDAGVGSYHPTEIGTHSFAIYPDADGTEEVTFNDTLMASVQLSDSSYAKDDGNLNSSSNRLMWYQRSGTIYEIAADGKMTSLSVGIQTKTESVGNLLQVELWKFDPNDEANPDTYGWVKVDPNPFVVLTNGAGNGEVVIENSHLGTLLTFPLQTPMDVTKGERFMAAIFQPTLIYDTNAGAYSNGVWCVASGNTAYPTRVMHFIQWSTTGLPDDADGALYQSIYPAPMIRLNFGNLVGVEETKKLNIELEQNIPNPFGNSTIINYTLKQNASNVQFKVVDITGKEVLSINEGKKSSGNYTLKLNKTNLSSGIYYYSLIVDEQRLTKKMIITE